MTFSSPITTADWQNADYVNEAIKSIEKQEEEFQFENFTMDQAELITSTIIKQIQEIERNDNSKESSPLSALISIRLWSGLTLSQRLYGNGVTLSNEDWAKRKSNTVRTYGNSSFLIGRNLIKKGKSIDSLPSDFAAHGGGFPILIKGVNTGPIGVIIVSGLEQWQDHHVIVEALRIILRK